jgi:hypothetical protein
MKHREMKWVKKKKRKKKKMMMMMNNKYNGKIKNSASVYSKIESY